MLSSDKIYLLSAGISVISCIGAIYFSRRAGKSERLARHYEASANRIAIGQLESMIYSNIATARGPIEHVSLEIAKLLLGKKVSELNERDNQLLEILKKKQNCVIENYINVYEIACGLFLDNKIDKKRFRETYTDNIKNLCEKDAFKKQMQPESTLKYTTIWKVYHSWCQAEQYN